MDSNFTELKDIAALRKASKCNKYCAMAGVFLALILSCVLIGIGFQKYNTEKPILDKKIVTEGLNDVQVNVIKLPCDTIGNTLSYKVEKTPVIVTEDNYNNKVCVLLCISVLLFMSLSLWGAFTILHKVLKSESDMNSKILDLQKEVYKETQMWKLSEQKGKSDFDLEKQKELFKLELKKPKKELEEVNNNPKK